MTQDDRSERLRDRRNRAKEKARPKGEEPSSSSSTSSSGSNDCETLSMWVPTELKEELKEHFQDVFVEYVSEEKEDLPKSRYYEALLRAGMENFDLEEVTSE